MEKQFKPKPAWCRANSVQLAEYSEQLRSELNDVVLPYSALMCRDVNCCNTNHLVDINTYVEAISAACLSSACCTIPFTRGKHSGCIPGWLE